MWPDPAWPANEGDEDSDEIPPNGVVDLAAEEEVGAGADSRTDGTGAGGDADTESYLSDIGDA